MMYTANFVAAVQVHGKTVREFKSGNDKEVYLPFKTDYSLYLKNLDSRRAVISVEIDGEDVLDGTQLVLDGNSSTELEGFLNATSSEVRKRFRFIEKTEKVREHRGEGPEDGLIRVSFKYERREPNWDFLNRPRRLIGDEKNPSRYREWTQPHDTGRGFMRGMRDTKGIRGQSGDSPQAFYGASNVNYNSMNDEGITVAGADTYQKFGTTYVGPLDSEEHVMVLLLRGETSDNQPVSKPVTTRKKAVCPTCGTKSKSGARFCSECATALV